MARHERQDADKRSTGVTSKTAFCLIIGPVELEARAVTAFLRLRQARNAARKSSGSGALA
jgi:hypothetical protein